MTSCICLQVTFTNTDRKYSTGEREAIAGMVACEHMHMFLFRGEHLHRKLITRHWPLIVSDYWFPFMTLTLCTLLAPPKNEIADMLSRLVKEDGSTVDDCVIYINDSILSQVRHFIQNGWPVELEVYVRLNYELSVFNDVRLHTCRHPYHNPGHTMLNMVHKVHPGIVRTKHMCRTSTHRRLHQRLWIVRGHCEINQANTPADSTNLVPGETMTANRNQLIRWSADCATQPTIIGSHT